MAERAGFEPALAETARPLFESGTMNHSDTSPFIFSIAIIPVGRYIVKACYICLLKSEGNM
jgi:hypothetical protein